MPEVQTRRSLQGSGRQVRARRAAKVYKVKRSLGLSLSALALSSVIALAGINAVVTTKNQPGAAQEFSTPQPALTGMGMPDQAPDQGASQGEVAIMAAAELLTSSDIVTEDSAEVTEARLKLEQLLTDFATGQDLEVPQSLPAPEYGEVVLPEGAPDQAKEDQNLAELTGRTDAASRATTREALVPQGKTSETVDPADGATHSSQELPGVEQVSPLSADAEAIAEPGEQTEQAEPQVAAVTLADIELATAELANLIGEQTLATVTTVAELKQKELAAAWDRTYALAKSTTGYSNGNIPRSAMSELSFAPGHYIRADAALMLELLNKEFRANFGHDIGMTDSYRSYSSQVSTKAAKGYLAARPGTSNHGWGLALDLRGSVAKWGTSERNWLVKHGRTYGWISPSWAQPGQGKEEPWHWEFAGRSVSGR